MYPAELTVSSDGPAGTAQSSKLGVFLKEDSQQYNNRPVYQLDRGGQYLYYDDTGNWLIGPTAGGSNGGITTVQQGLLTPPATGWKYDCVLGNWTSAPCSALCGDGTTTSTRDVVKTEENGGKPCDTQRWKQSDCNRGECFGKYYF